MKTHHCVIFCSSLMLAGCLPEERVWWSPQGDVAVVAAGDMVQLVTADGHRSRPLNLGKQDELFKSVSWLRDGSGFRGAAHAGDREVG
jgi:hypothetical protein